MPHLPQVFDGQGGERYVFEDEKEWDRHVVEGHVEDEGRGAEVDGGLCSCSYRFIGCCC